MHFTRDGLTLYIMLKTISLCNLIAVLIILLVSTPIFVVTSHHHLISGGDGRLAIQSHTCNTKDVHQDLPAGDTCLACLRAGLFVASFSADRVSTRIAPVGATMTTADRLPVESDDLACPKRGPPIFHS